MQVSNDSYILKFTSLLGTNVSSNIYFQYILGNTTWIYYDTKGDEPWDPNNFVAQPLVKTNIGTTPEGSEWAKVNLPSELLGGTHWAFKDLVEVPEDLEPGEYVLSFRWDCQQSPQVWNSCSSIQIMP